MAKLYAWSEAVEDFEKLDGNQKLWVESARDRLEQRGAEIGKDLGNLNYAKLAGFKELKNNKLGLRLIFLPKEKGTIEIIEIAGIGKRADEEIFKIVEKRRKKR